MRAPMCRVSGQGVRVLEPQGTLFFLLLMVAFAGLLIWMALTKQIVFRVLAACLAFIPSPGTGSTQRLPDGIHCRRSRGPRNHPPQDA